MSFYEPCLCFIAKEPCDPDVKCLVFWKAAAKKALPFCVSCPDDTKGAVLYGMCKDIARMEPSVCNEYRNRPAAGGIIAFGNFRTKYA